MSFLCNICSCIFTQKIGLQRHLDNKRCKIDYCELNELIETLKKSPSEPLVINNENQIENKIENQIINNHIINENITNTVNINIVINPITKLNTKHITTDRLKLLILKYDDMSKKTPEKLNLLLSGYIKDVICDSEHPENHAIKYTKVRPPTYSCKVEDTNGNTINVIKGLKDTCELVTDPILLTLKRKIKQFLIKYAKDDKDDFDYGLYDTAIEQLRKEFNNDNVKKALSCVLQNDILNNIKMKFNYNKH